MEDNEATGLPALSQDTSVSPPTAAPTSGTITGLKPSTAYRVQVRAANSGGESPWSASGSGTTNAASGSNNAPIVIVQAALDPVTNIRCAAHSATTPSYTHQFAGQQSGLYRPHGEQPIELAAVLRRELGRDTAHLS